jgi:hypothetical protein
MASYPVRGRSGNGRGVAKAVANLGAGAGATRSELAHARPAADAGSPDQPDGGEGVERPAWWPISGVGRPGLCPPAPDRSDPPLRLDRAGRHRATPQPATAADELAALAHEAVDRNVCRPNCLSPPDGCVQQPGPSRAEPSHHRRFRESAGRPSGGWPRESSSWTARSPSRGTRRRPIPSRFQPPVVQPPPGFLPNRITGKLESAPRTSSTSTLLRPGAYERGPRVWLNP